MQETYQDLEKQAKKDNSNWDNIVNHAWKKEGVRDLNSFYQYLKENFHPPKKKQS